jgi:hypothetical protein
MIKIEKKDKVIAHLYSDERRFDKMKEKELKKIKKKAKKIHFKMQEIIDEIDKKENPSLSFYNNITQKTNDLDKMITRLNLLQEMKTDLQHTLKKARKYIENN